ncbi:NUDIX domain-containing protein [Nocardioides sp. STR2]|uniref:NUDIX domain-containing protein n=1 Tax=Nocardioides pini TaxID=2975053 RepID=A0ABT4CC75_9ACTN|nr:NUDIX domain-containing protein [Nocardioides pini]MCY4726565.1 NUDIX domain-containing protein [Nocardioides pini]
MEPRDVRAAGAVVTRKGGEVLLVHRPKYDDWSFPKGKLDRGEHVVTAAVREVAEETGLDVRLGPALSCQRYRMSNGRWKTVDYWTARVVGSDEVSGYRPNAEIDAVEWVGWKEAGERLTYSYDRDTLVEARPLRRRTRALVVLRHAEARSRKGWKKDDRRRPLVRLGEAQSERLVPILAAFDVTVAHTSSSTRCVQTVMPYADVTGWPVKLYDELSEEDSTVEGVVDLVDDLLHGDLDTGGAVLCSHRPVLPTVLDALEVPDVFLEPGSMLVVHHRKGRVVASELIAP